MKADSCAEQEAWRLMLRLGRCPDASLCKEGATYRICEAAGVPGREENVSEAAIAFCLKRDWLTRDHAALIPSDAGYAALRRAEAGADPFREQHQWRSMTVKEKDGTRRSVLINDAESPLGWLRSRKDRNGRPLISAEQFAAGERLRRDYWFALLSAQVTANWSALVPSRRTRRGPSGGTTALRDEVLAAKARVRSALEAVGAELAGVLVDVCCELKGLEEAEKVNGWPQRAGKVVLQIALTRLAKHYGLLQEAARKRRLRHWGSEDYRPTLEAWRDSQR